MFDQCAENDFACREILHVSGDWKVAPVSTLMDERFNNVIKHFLTYAHKDEGFVLKDEIGAHFKELSQCYGWMGHG